MPLQVRAYDDIHTYTHTYIHTSGEGLRAFAGAGLSYDVAQ